MTVPVFESWWFFTGSAPSDTPPADLRVHMSGANVVVDWTDTVSDNTGYKVERAEGIGAFALLATVGDVGTYTDVGPFNAGSVYSYRVVVIGGVLNDQFSNGNSITPIIVPGGRGRRLRRLAGIMPRR